MATSRSTESTSLPTWGLFVREPFAERIISGRKTWEIRKRPTDRRGRIGILSRRGLVGTVELHEVLGPFRVIDLVHHVARHRAPLRLLEEYAAGAALYAWVLREPLRQDPPLVLARGRGSMVWFRLSSAASSGRSSGAR